MFPDLTPIERQLLGLSLETEKGTVGTVSGTN
jgi:hypothetical protein